MKKLLLLAFLAIGFNVIAQDWPVKKMVLEKKAQQVKFVPIPAFTFKGNRSLQQRGTWQALQLNSSFSIQLLRDRPEALRMLVPININTFLVCDLVKIELGNIKFTENKLDYIDGVKIPVTYRGIVVGEKSKNTVTLTVNESYISFVASLATKTIYVSKIDGGDKSNYRLYNSDQVQFPSVPLVCGTSAESSSQLVKDIQSPGYSNRSTAPEDKCVFVFVDCFDSLYQWRGSNTQQTINYVYDLFNNVGAAYSNESINIQILAINVWTNTDPYRQTSRKVALDDLSANYKDSFWGNICVGLDFSLNSTKSRSGIAADIGRVKGVAPNTCPAYTVNNSPFCYNDLNYAVSVQNFPTGPNSTGSQVYLVTHEIGHLLGVHHTKWCGWKLTSNPDIFGALDSCDVMEAKDTLTPVCAQGPPPGPTGATIMSYCVTSPASFVNYNNGFGLLPGNALRTFVDQTACIPVCTNCVSTLKPFNSIKANQSLTAAHYKPPQQSSLMDIKRFLNFMNVDLELKQQAQ